MRVQIEFDLQNDACIVHWPWGSASFLYNTESGPKILEALKNFAIESSRCQRPEASGRSFTLSDLNAIRKAVEGTPRQVKVTKLVEGRNVQSLDDLLGDDDMFGLGADL